MKKTQPIEKEFISVVLWYNDFPLLIAKSSTGVCYNNQIGGVMCKQGNIEGFIIPISISILVELEILKPEFWLNLDWNLEETNKLVNQKTNELVEKINSSDIFKLKNFQITNNEIEAWFQCTFVYNEKEFEGVITWENSD